MMDLLRNEGVFIAWAVLLLAGLGILFRYASRRAEGRTAVVLLGTVIFALSLGQFAFFYFYYIPKIRAETAREMEILLESMNIIELDNVKQNDLVLAYQRENEALNQTVRSLRSRIEAPRDRTAEARAGSAPPKTRAERESAAASPSPPAAAEPSSRKGKRYQPMPSNAGYRIKVLTPEPNREFGQHLKSAFEWLRFAVNAVGLEPENESRIVYHADADREQADYIAAFLRYTYKITVPTQLDADPVRASTFQVYLTGDTGIYWKSRMR